MNSMSKGRIVDPQQLTDLIKRSDRIVVTREPIGGSPELFESCQPLDIDAFLDALLIAKPQNQFHCMCIGSPAIYLYRGQEILAEITNHHATSIRCSLWDSDAPITDVHSWLTWFDERGISGPREEYEDSVETSRQDEIDYKRWNDKTPLFLRGAWRNAMSDSSMGIVNIKPLVDDMRKQMASRKDVIIELFDWFGSGAGPWSGFPSYESAAEELLLQFDSQELIDTVDPDHFTSAQLEGAARLFGGWHFHTQRKGHLQMLPDEIKQAFWLAVKDTDDEDKLARARKAFFE